MLDKWKVLGHAVTTQRSVDALGRRLAPGGLGNIFSPPLEITFEPWVRAWATVCTGLNCDGLSRRSFLQLGVAGMASVGLPQMLRAREQSSQASGSKKNTSVILLWLDGGPSHIDTLDPNPDRPDLPHYGAGEKTSPLTEGCQLSEPARSQKLMTSRSAPMASWVKCSEAESIRSVWPVGAVSKMIRSNSSSFCRCRASPSVYAVFASTCSGTSGKRSGVANDARPSMTTLSTRSETRSSTSVSTRADLRTASTARPSMAAEATDTTGWPGSVSHGP